MKINIPFCYTAEVIFHKDNSNLKKCHSKKLLLIDSVEVNIKEYDNLPVAIKKISSFDENKNVNYYWDNKNLYTMYFDLFENKENIDAVKKVKITKEYFKEHIENKTNEINQNLSIPTMKNVFYSFWEAAQNKIEDKQRVYTKTEAIKESILYIKDNKNELIKEIKRVAKNFIFIDDFLYLKANEPRYHVCEFNLYDDEDNSIIEPCVSLFILPEFCYDFKSNFFTALEYEEAIKFTLEIAKNKNIENKNILKLERLEVLIPSAVKLKINKKNKDEMIKINF